MLMLNACLNIIAWRQMKSRNGSAAALTVSNKKALVCKSTGLVATSLYKLLVLA